MKYDWKQQLVRVRPIEWLMVLLVVVGAVLRLWNFSHTLQFLGDQGRDALVVSRIFKERDVILIGPVTSTGNMYLGPLYYYFMLPFLMMSYPSPLGPAYAIALISIVTIILMYWLGKEMVGEKAAAIATFFFTFSSTIIAYSRFSWNPNPAPLLGLLFIWALFQTEHKKYWHWVIVSVAVAVLIQLHYVTLLVLPVAGVFWLLQVRTWPKMNTKLRSQFLRSTVASIAVFLAFLSPLVAFDVRHDWLNVRSLQKFVTTSQDSVESMPLLQKLSATLAETHGRSLQLFFELSIGKQGIFQLYSEDVQRLINTILLVVVLMLFGYLLTRKDNPYRTAHKVLAVTYLVSVIGLAFYRSSVFDHYVIFFLPVAFLIFGSILVWLSRWKVGWPVVATTLVLFLGFNLPRIPLQSLGWTIDDMKATADTIAQRVTPGEKYNIVLLSETKDIYGENYRYFLSTTQTPPLRIEHFGEVETLFIIDEQKLEKDVTSLPIYEIVVFPNKEPVEVYSIPDGPRITVLRK